MKNMKNSTKKWLTVTGCLVLCAVLVVLIGGKLKTPKPIDEPLPPQSSAESGVTVDDTTDRDVVVTPPEIPKTDTPSGNGAVSSGTDQTIQGDPKKPAPTEDELKDPTKKPDGTPVTDQDKPVDHDKVEPPKEPSKPSDGGIPGFDNVPDAGPNEVTIVDGDGDINKQVGQMD